MADWPLPPYVEPRGPRGDDRAVVRAFLTAEPAPHSDRLHVEGPVLRAHRDVPAALRIGARTVLVRVDVPDDLLAVKAVIEGVLGEEGLTRLDEETPLAVAPAMQMVSARLSIWDLWGADLDEGFADLRTAAVGGEDDILLGGGGPPTGLEPGGYEPPEGDRP